MDWKLNKKQIDEVCAIFTELCEKIADKEISLSFSARRYEEESGEVYFTYDVNAIYKGKLIYIKMGSYSPLMGSEITNAEVEKIITLLKGDK